MVLMLLESLRHPKELKAMYHLKQRQSRLSSDPRPLDVLATELSDIDFCYAVLHRVSRSFAAVIQQLPSELRDAVCIFYLVLRGLDTIEDDTAVPVDKRDRLLRTFYQKHADKDWSITGIGDAEDYRLLLENYQKVISAFQDLGPEFKSVILSICQEMGEGMAEFLEKEVEEVADYDQYCHYVAGLVGIGLSRLFSVSKVEGEKIAAQKELANSMGLFLQKTNIIRDYHEDILADRTFWPREIWGNYGAEMQSFLLSRGPKAIHCLNHLVTDALSHASDCLSYLEMIKHPDVFRFCAIPQVMAIATLCEVYNNPDVFRKNVKIRKGLAAKLILETNNYRDVQNVFEKVAIDIFKKIPKDDPNASLISIYLRRLVNQEAKIKEIELFSKQRSFSEEHAIAS